MPDDDISLSEKRMYGEQREGTVAYVASGAGVATVELSGDQVGRFGLAERCTARDVAAADGRVFAATDEDVLIGGEDFAGLDFGPAVAVTVAGDAPDAPDGALLAADEDGGVFRYDEGDWTRLGATDGVRALAGDLVAAADGVYRIDGDGLSHVGLDDARDAAAGGAVLAATGDGLYRLGPGWTRDREGVFAAVAADADRAHAATADALFAREGDGDWEELSPPVAEPIADVGYGECVYAVTERGTFLVFADPEVTPDGTGGWGSRSLGLPDVRAMAVV